MKIKKLKKKLLLKSKEMEQLQIQLTEEKLEKDQLEKTNSLLAEQSLNEEKQKRVHTYAALLIPGSNHLPVCLTCSLHPDTNQRFNWRTS